MLTTAYREHFGWRVDDQEHPPRLLLGHNMVALAMPRGTGKVVLDYLCRHDNRGPVIEFDPGTWVFLADPNALVVTPTDLPDDVKLLGVGVTLPMPLAQASLSARWVVAPNVRQRWLPSLAALVAAVRATTSFR